MVEMIATATEVQNNFGFYLRVVMDGQEVIITKNGTEVGRFVPRDKAVSFLTDSLAGILHSDVSIDEAREDALRKKYEVVH